MKRATEFYYNGSPNNANKNVTLITITPIIMIIIINNNYIMMMMMLIVIYLLSLLQSPLSITLIKLLRILLTIATAITIPMTQIIKEVMADILIQNTCRHSLNAFYSHRKG